MAQRNIDQKKKAETFNPAPRDKLAADPRKHAASTRSSMRNSKRDLSTPFRHPIP